MFGEKLWIFYYLSKLNLVPLQSSHPVLVFDWEVVGAKMLFFQKKLANNILWSNGLFVTLLGGRSEVGKGSKLANDKKSTIFLQTLWNLVNVMFSWGGNIDQVSWYSEKNCEFFIISKFWTLSHFIVVTLYLFLETLRDYTPGPPSQGSDSRRHLFVQRPSYSYLYKRVLVDFWIFFALSEHCAIYSPV